MQQFNLVLFISVGFIIYVTSSSELPPKLLLISWDGFGWNYIEKLPKASLLNFHSFISEGVRVKYIENVFPTFTLPNHMSMVTGLYPESHGVVNNHFFDPDLNSTSPNEAWTVNDTQWVDEHAEPIWVTNSKAGGGRRSGSVMFPLSGVRIKGLVPENLKPENWSILETNFTARNRIDLALEWLSTSKEPVNFVAVYFPDTDHLSHVYGPDSPEVLRSIQQRDSDLAYLMEQTKQKGLFEKLNIIITGDHGLVPVYPSNEINLDLLVDPDLYESYPKMGSHSSATVLHIMPKLQEHKNLILHRLKHINMHVALKGESDDLRELHYEKNKRIGPIVIFAEQSYFFTINSTPFWSPKGQHGYEPRYNIDMYPLFIARGPAFKKGLTDAAPFRIIDIYALMCHILDLRPASNNGTLDNVRHILADVAYTGSFSFVGVAVGCFIVILCLIIVAVGCWRIRKAKSVTASYRRTFIQTASDDEDGALVTSDEEL